MDRDTGAADVDGARTTSGEPRDALRSDAGRRAFLGTIAAAGLGAGLARWLPGGEVGSVERNEVEIVYGVARADPADPSSLTRRTKTVPADWHEALSRAVETHRGLPFAELTGYVGSFVVPGDLDDPAASIAVQSTAGGLRDELAGRSMDVSFDVSVLDDLPDPSGGSPSLRPSVVADLADRTVPGGVLCGADARLGSLAPALRDPSTGDRFLATANHLYGGGGADHRGDPLYLQADGEREAVARVRRGFADEDLLVADPVVGRIPASRISEATPGRVGGQFTRLGLADLQARGEPLEKVGAVSGHTTGRIEGIDGITFFTGNGIRTGQLIWGDEETFTDGDSGSVNYHVDPEADDQVLVGGLNSARTWWPGADFTWGTAAYRIREARGLVF